MIVANKKRAAVGRREMQIVLTVYALISFCDVFTTGRPFSPPEFRYYRDYPTSLNERVLQIFVSLQLGLTTAFFWILMLFGLLGFQILDDGTPLSIGIIVGSAVVLCGATLYISLDTAFSITGSFLSARYSNKSIALYTLNLGLPLLSSLIFAGSQIYLVVKILEELKPLSKLFPDRRAD